MLLAIVEKETGRIVFETEEWKSERIRAEKEKQLVCGSGNGGKRKKEIEVDKPPEGAGC